LSDTTVTAFGTRPIHITTSLLPVSYSSCSTLVPPLHAPLSSDAPPESTSRPDVVIHVGVGSPGGIKLEQRARKWGYEKKDVDGELAAIEQDSKRRGAAEERYKGVEEELRTQVDGEKVRDWVKKMGFQEIELSEDAGALPLFSLLPAASLS
jgi:pyroglutamyl-peptidase